MKNLPFKFAFVNEAADREYKQLPANVQRTFGSNLRVIQNGFKSGIEFTFLNNIGAGVIELKINGSPAYRCIYIAKYLETVVVLHSFVKTTNGVDKQAMKVAEQRLKELMVDVNQAKKTS